ncbi:MAG: hypothetical protein AAF456_02225 [Planctomycetota bacterium]
MSSSEREDCMTEIDGLLADAVRRIRTRTSREQQKQSVASLKRLVRAATLDAATLDDVESLSAHSTRRSGAWHAGWVSGIAAAAVIAVSMFVVLYRTPVSFGDQIADAIAGVEWIRVVESDGNRTVCESWYSASKGISAFKSSETIEFRDHLVGECLTYSHDSDELCRTNEFGFESRNHFANLISQLQESRQSQEELICQFLTSVTGDLKVEGQRVVQAGDHVEHEIDAVLDGRPIQIRIIVELESRLPQSCEISRVIDGSLSIFRKLEFDYPDSGPADVFELGVPIDATLVDRVATDEERALLASVRSFARFDDYRAISVRYDPDDPAWWVNASVEILYRKGKRWRRSHMFVGFSEQAADGEGWIVHEGPAEGIDMAKWWSAQIERSVGADGSPEDGQAMNLRIGRQEWSVRGNVFTEAPFETDVPSFWDLLPDFKARPPMGGSGRQFQGQVVEDSEAGPRGTTMFELTPQGAGPENSSRFWVDPDQGYLVVRSELGSNFSTIVEEARQSPAGVWYPARTLRLSTTPDGNVRKEVTEFYVDFEAEIPDDLFLIND